MTSLFAISLTIGILALGAWIAFAAVAGSVQGWERFDPEAAFGRSGRMGLAALTGFGMAGLSASYAGWSDAPTIIAAIGGAVGLAAASAWLGAPAPE